MPTVGSLVSELRASTQKLRADFAEGIAITKQATGRMSAILDEFGRPAFREFERSGRRARAVVVDIESAMSKGARAAKGLAMPLLDEVAPALGQTTSKMATAVSTSVALGSGWGALAIAGSTLAGMLVGDLLAAWQANTQRSSEFRRSLESMELGRITGEVEKLRKELEEAVEKLREAKKAADEGPFRGLTRIGPAGTGALEMPEVAPSAPGPSAAETDRDATLTRLAAARRAREAAQEGEDFGAGMRQLQQQLQDIGKLRMQVQQAQRGLFDFLLPHAGIEGEFRESLRRARDLEIEGAGPEAARLRAATARRREFRFAGEVLGPGILRDLEGTAGFEATTGGGLQEILDATALSDARKELEAIEKLAAELMNDVAMSGGLEAITGGTTAEIMALPKLVDPMKDLEEALRRINDEKRVFGDLFDDMPAQMDATRTAIMGLIAQGVDPLDSRIVQLKADFDRLKSVANLNDVFRSTFQTGTAELNNFIRSVVSGTDRIDLAFANMGLSIATNLLNNVINRGLKPLEDQVVNFLTKLAEMGISAFASSGRSGFVGSGNVSISENVRATKMAEGGIATRATFAMIGEAGPEAVIPLDRLGGLGGGVVVNVYNEAGGDGYEATTSQSRGPSGERMIDIIVARSVRKQIGLGHFDKDFGSSYGLARRGVQR